MNLIPDVSLITKSGLIRDLITASKCQWPVHIKLIPLLTKIIKNILSYSKGVQKKSVKDGIESEKLTIFSV